MVLKGLLFSIAFYLGFKSFNESFKSREYSMAPSKIKLFKSFQNNYLIVFGLVRLADWIQGPYVYKIYSSYGYTKNDIGYLYVIGFIASGIFGIFNGIICDKFGRKLTCLIFCVLFGLNCMIIHFDDFGLLMFGRLLSGIAQSFLHSSFESYMVARHTDLKFNKVLLSETIMMSMSLNSILGRIFICVLIYWHIIYIFNISYHSYMCWKSIQFCHGNIQIYWI